MSLSKEEMEERLKTEIVSFRKFDKDRFIRRRKDRIHEAERWEKGPSVDEPKKYVVAELDGGIEAYFLKPGKETLRDNGNPHDMVPKLGGIYDDYTFADTWKEILKVAVEDIELFKMLLVLIYRNGYLLDHQYIDEEEKRVRYAPSEEIAACIDQIDEEAGRELPEGGLWGLLHFMDVLGWNEDVKYHSEESPENRGWKKFNVGRINNFMSCVKVPYLFATFVHDEVLKKADRPHTIKFDKTVDVAQALINSNGVCTPTLTELEEWFSPLMHK